MYFEALLRDKFQYKFPYTMLEYQFLNAFLYKNNKKNTKVVSENVFKYRKPLKYEIRNF